MAKALTDLVAAGVAVWLDDLSRTRINSGTLAKSVEAGDIVGITTNPTIFAKAIGAGSGYEDQLRDLALRGTAIGRAGTDDAQAVAEPVVRDRHGRQRAGRGHLCRRRDGQRQANSQRQPCLQSLPCHRPASCA